MSSPNGAFPAHKLVFGMMLFACFIPFQSIIIPMAVILGSLGRIGNQLIDATGWSSRLRQPDGQPGDRPRGSTASASPRCFSATTTRRSRPEAVQRPQDLDRNAKAVATFDANIEIVGPAARTRL